MNRIDPNNGPIQTPYELFRALLRLADDESVAVMRLHIGQLSTSRLENVCSEELSLRQRARNEADFRTGVEQAARIREQQAASRATTVAARSLVEAR